MAILNDSYSWSWHEVEDPRNPQIQIFHKEGDVEYITNYFKEGNEVKVLRIDIFRTGIADSPIDTEVQDTRYPLTESGLKAITRDWIHPISTDMFTSDRYILAVLQ